MRICAGLALGMIVPALFLLAQSEARAAAHRKANYLRNTTQPHVILFNDTAQKAIKQYEADIAGPDLPYFLLQERGAAWKSRPVDIVFADKDRLFLLLRKPGGAVETSISVDRKHVIFFGSHYKKVVLP